jgi:hypothetical protein
MDSDRNITDIEIKCTEAVNVLPAGSSFQKDSMKKLSIIHFTFLAANDNALARVPLRRSVLLLEATSSLDTENEKQIMEL